MATGAHTEESEPWGFWEPKSTQQNCRARFPLGTGTLQPKLSGHQIDRPLRQSGEGALLFRLVREQLHDFGAKIIGEPMLDLGELADLID